MVFPTTGIALRLCGEVAGLLGIGDAHFVKTEAEIQENISLLLPNLVLFLKCLTLKEMNLVKLTLSLFPIQVAQFSLRGGCILPLTSSTAACNIADYFFLGGDHSLRGFQMRGVGPRQGKNSLGGKV
jgi:outer membrane protein insertion porin family